MELIVPFGFSSTFIPKKAMPITNINTEKSMVLSIFYYLCTAICSNYGAKVVKIIGIYLIIYLNND